MGGVESFVWELAARLPAHGIDVEVLAGRGAIRRPLPNGNLKTFQYVSRNMLSRVPVLDRSPTLVKFFERLTFGYFALPTLLRSKYDIIHIQKPYDLPTVVGVRLARGSKLLFGCHGTDYYPGDKTLARYADGAVSCSQFNASQIRDHYGFKPIVVFNGFEPRIFHPAPCDPALRSRYAAPSDSVLLFAGRLIRWKGIHNLLEALARLDLDVKLLIAGDGEDRSFLERRAKDLGISARVFFLGRVEQEDLARFYLISDLVVLPSLAHETFSIVACEALASERPVVGTTVGGIPELVHELVPPDDPAALADKIRSLLADPAGRAETARKGREYVFANLTWEATTLRVLDVYRRLARGDRVFDVEEHK